MRKGNKYIVTSKTTRVSEGYSDLCWMDIGVHKLEEAASVNEKYRFVVTLGQERFEYHCPAKTLLSTFQRKDVRIKYSRKKGGEFSFFFEYTTGCLYHSLSNMGDEDNLICKLSSAATINAEEYLNRALASLDPNTLPLLIARTALWADYEQDHLPVIQANEQTEKYKGSPAKYPYVKRKAVNENRGWNDDTKTLYLDDNSYPNTQMKNALFKRFKRIPQGYETCHIWEGTCYKTKYHTCFANLVLLPRAIASLSDHNDTVKAILKYRAYQLFKFVPDGEKIPVKPQLYPKDEEWLKL